MDKIRYSAPAKKWREALPLGNGFTGIMAYGSLKKERLCFNDATLWSGYPKDYNANGTGNLTAVRKSVLEGRNFEADKLCEEKLTGFYSEAFMPLGEVKLDFAGLSSENFMRCLDLSTAVHTVTAKGCKSELFSSYPDRISAYKIKSDKRFSVKIGAESKLRSETKIDGGHLYLVGNAPDYAAPNYLFRELRPKVRIIFYIKRIIPIRRKSRLCRRDKRDAFDRGKRSYRTAAGSSEKFRRIGRSQKHGRELVKNQLQMEKRPCHRSLQRQTDIRLE